MTFTSNCFFNSAELETAFSESDDINIQVHIDYNCIGKDSEMVGDKSSALAAHSHRHCSYSQLSLHVFRCTCKVGS